MDKPTTEPMKTIEYWLLSITDPKTAEYPPRWKWTKWRLTYSPNRPLDMGASNMVVDYREYPIDPDKYHQIAMRLIESDRGA